MLPHLMASGLVGFMIGIVYWSKYGGRNDNDGNLKVN